MKQSILLIWNRMGDYHRARWKALTEQWQGEVHAADLGAGDTLYPWEDTTQSRYYHRLSDRPVEVKDTWRRVKAFRDVLKKEKIQWVAIPGYGRKEYLLFLIWCKLKGIKVIMFAESWYGRNPLTNTLKSIFLKWVCQRYFVSGIRAEQHFHKRLKIPVRQIEKGYSVVDNYHFTQPTKPVEKKKILLCVARFSEEKNHRILFDAFLTSQLSKTWKLHCVGAGPLNNEFKALESKHPEILKISDWASYESLPDIYQEASVFILPSTFEPWGLVVNEAMAAGLPVIVSDACGCKPDLVKEENGWVFKDQEQLTLILDEISANLDSKKGMNSKKKIQNFSPDSWTSTILKLVGGESK